MKITRRRLTILALCPLLLLLTYANIHMLKRAMHRRSARRILTLAELAPLPKSAAEVKSYSKAFLFTAMHFLRFRASQADIEAFVRESPILDGTEWTTYSKDKQRLVDPGYGSGTARLLPDGNEYFPPPYESAPPWYMPEIRGAGRGCTFRTQRNEFYGEVIVDEEENLVFVHLDFG